MMRNEVGQTSYRFESISLITARKFIRSINLPILVASFFLTASALAQTTVLPATDDDLQRLLAKARTVKNYSRQCTGENCPSIDCPTAQRLNDELIEALYFSKYQYYWLSLAANKQRDHYRSTAASVTRDAARQAELETIAAYQEYVVNIASAVLDIASASASFDALSKNSRKLDELSTAEFLGQLDTLYEGAKSFENAAAMISDARSGGTRPKIFNVSNSELNDHKSTISDVRSIVQEAVKNGRDWRATVRSGNAISALGQIVGRYAKAFARSEIEERRRLSDSLANEVAAGEKAMTAAFRNWVRFQSRRNLAEDIYLLSKDLYSSSETGSWARCIGKLSIACGSFRTTAKGRVPDFAQVTFYGDNFELATADRPGEWGRAVQYLGGVFNVLSKNLATVNITDVRPTITMAKSTVKAGEQLDADFTAPACYPPDSWIGVVRSGVPHGTEATNASNAGRRHRLQRQQKGKAILTAPDEPGSYDLRMNDLATGREVASVTFTVEPKENASIGSNFSVSVSPTSPNRTVDAGMLERLKSWRDSLDKLAPGTGVAFVYLRNALDEVRGPGADLRRIEFRNSPTGAVIDPLREPVYSSYEFYVLPQGFYHVTAVMWSTHDLYKLESTIQVRSGAITELAFGGSSKLGRVKVEMHSVAGEKIGGYNFVHTENDEEKWYHAVNGTEPVIDLPPGPYRIDVKQNNAMRIWTQVITVEAGQTFTVKPINRGRIAVRKGDAPAGTVTAIRTAADKHIGYLNFDHDEYLDVPAGTYRVGNQQLVVESGKTVFLKQ